MNSVPLSEDKTAKDEDANIFAVCLLVPEETLRGELDRKPLDLSDDRRLTELCDLFEVSQSAMLLRIKLLK